MRCLLVSLLSGLLLLAAPIAASDSSVFAAAAVDKKQGGAGKSGADADKGWFKGKGKGKGPKLADWATKLRGQVPGKFDDKAAKKIFDKLPSTEGKPKPTVDEYKAKGWHYQIKEEK